MHNVSNLDIMAGGNLGIIANGAEYLHRRFTVSYSRSFFCSNHMHTIVAIPQYVIAAALVPTYFNNTKAPIVFLSLPLIFKAIELCTKKGSTPNKTARGGDHLMRISSKIIILVASINEIFTASNSSSRLFAALRALGLSQNLIMDSATTGMYAMSGMENFNEAIVQARGLP